MTRLRPALRPGDRAARPAGKRSHRLSDVVAPESKRARDLAHRVHTGLVRLRRTSSRILDVPRRPRTLPMPAGFPVLRALTVRRASCVRAPGGAAAQRWRSPLVAARHALGGRRGMRSTGNSDKEGLGVIIVDTHLARAVLHVHDDDCKLARQAVSLTGRSFHRLSGGGRARARARRGASGRWCDCCSRAPGFGSANRPDVPPCRLAGVGPRVRGGSSAGSPGFRL